MSKKIQDYKISLFENALSSNHSQLKINNYFENIVTGKWQDEVLAYRNNKKEKTKIPAVTASGYFSGRKDSDLQEHSGLLVIDIDEKDQELPINSIRDSLKEIPEILAIHSSLGGKGLAVYFKIRRDKHFESFEAITKMLANDYNINPDMHCSNIGRLRFVSYDPDCYLNYGAQTWSYFENKENRISANEKQYSNIIYSENDINYILDQIKAKHINIAPDYYSWLRIAFALSDKLGDSGKEAFKIISAYYPGKQKITPEQQFEKCLKRGRSGVSIGTFFYFAKLAGCEIVSDRTKKITSIGKIRKKQEKQIGSGAIGDGRKDAKEYLKEFEGITGSDIDNVLNQIWDSPIKDINSEEGTIHDIEVFLKSNYKFKLNEITNIVEINEKPIDDYFFNSVYLKCRKIIEKTNSDLIKSIIHSDFTPKYNPVFDFIEKNKNLKPSGNVEKLAKCIDSNIKYKDSNFLRYFLEKWLISIIASAHGIYSILCFVLTGQTQGTWKSNFFRELLPEPLRWLFAINKLDGKEADIAQLMCCKLIILDDEFGGKSKQDEKRFKELISKDVFSIRKPYGRYFEDMRRLAVLCGTTNEEQIINDLTGNRRIIPIQVNYVDEHKYNEIDKTELFMELYWKFRENQKGWFLTKEDITRLNEVCFDANQVTPESELPLKYFTKAYPNAINAKFLSSSEIRSHIEQRSGIKLSQQKLSIALKNIGYEYERKTIDGVKIRGFWVNEKNEFNQTSTETNTQDEDNNNGIVEDLPF